MSDARGGASAWRQNALLAIASVVLTVALLGLVEVALRVSGLGAADASRLKYQQVFLPVLVPGQRADGTAILRPADARLPYQSILREKPPGTIRIFTFGESAVAGLGYSPNVTFARDLDRLLRAAYPDLHFEVVNLGIVALSSREVRQLVEDVLAHYEPDIVIIYTGNNEFLEMHAEKYARAHAGALARVAGAVRDTHAYRLIDRLVSRPPRASSIAMQDLANDDLRLSEAAAHRGHRRIARRDRRRRRRLRGERGRDVAAAEAGRCTRDRDDGGVQLEVARGAERPVRLTGPASSWRGPGRGADAWSRCRVAATARLEARRRSSATSGCSAARSLPRRWATSPRRAPTTSPR